MGVITMTTIYGQLAKSGLLPGEMSAAILAGNMPPLEEIVTALLIGSIDCQAVTAKDQQSTWFERRIARQVLILAFMSALSQFSRPEHFL